MKFFVCSILLFSLSSTLFSYDKNISKENIKITTYSQESFLKSDFYNNREFSTGINIISMNDVVNVSINGFKYRGELIFIDNLKPGEYFILIEKTDYTTVKFWLNIPENTRTVIQVSLERETGFLKVNTNTNENIYFLNGFNYDGFSPIPTGLYTLTVKSFGYEDIKANVYISRNSITTINLVLDKAEFKIKNLRIQKKDFNPLGSGSFGTNLIYIDVNGPGKSSFYIKKGNNIVFSKDLEFTSWTYKIPYNGTDNNGLVLDNGEYEVFLKTDNDETKYGSFKINTKLFNKIIPFEKYSGLQFNPLGIINYGISQSGLGYSYSINESSLSLSYINYFRSNTLLGGSCNLNMTSDSSYFNLSLELKQNFKLPIGEIGISLGYHLDKTSVISLNIPYTLIINNFFLGFSPSVEYYIGNNLFYVGGIGIGYSSQKQFGGISCRIETEDFSIYNFTFGGEYYFLLPKTQSYLGIKINNKNQFTLGCSINLLY